MRRVFPVCVCVGLHVSRFASDVFGSTQEIDLVPGGSSIPVTKRNRLKYIYLVGALHLDTSIKRQCAAFRRGLNLLIPKEQLMVFTEPELQVVGGPCDVGMRNKSWHCALCSDPVFDRY
jgi:hypothetical protein